MADFDPRPWDDTSMGLRMRRFDAMRAAGNALNDPGADLDTIRNSALAAGQPDIADQVQNYAKTAQNQEDQAAKDAEAQKLKANVTEVGKLAAAGTPEAYAAARSRAFQLGMFDQGTALEEMHKTARTDLASKVGQAALLAPDEETWLGTAIPALKNAGIDVTGYDQPGGRDLALANSGLGTQVYKTRAASDLQDQKSQAMMDVQRLKADAAKGGGAGTAHIKNTEYVKQMYPGISQSDAEIYAAKPGTFKVSMITDANGQPNYNLTHIDAGTKSAVDAANRQANYVAAQNAVQNQADGGQRETNPDALFWSLYMQGSGKETAARNAVTRSEALNPQHIGSPAYRNSPQGASDLTASRDASKSNVNLAAQKNRLDAVDALIGQVRGMAGAEGSPQRATFEASIGPIIQNSGKEFWNNKLPWSVDSKIPGVIHATRSNVKFLQDELAQYIQTKGGSSDARARNAFDAIGELQNSTDTPTFLNRLDNLQHVVGTLRQVQPVQIQGVQSHIMQPGQAGQSGTAQTNAIPERPLSVPPRSQWSRSTGMWRDQTGKIYDPQGRPVQ
jgi:hypothetical protein